MTRSYVCDLTGKEDSQSASSQAVTDRSADRNGLKDAQLCSRSEKGEKREGKVDSRHS